MVQSVSINIKRGTRMKTRREMIYEFMVALASNPKACDSSFDVDEDYYGDIGLRVEKMACILADQFIEEHN